MNVIQSGDTRDNPMGERKVCRRRGQLQFQAGARICQENESFFKKEKWYNCNNTFKGDKRNTVENMFEQLARDLEKRKVCFPEPSMYMAVASQ